MLTIVRTSNSKLIKNPAVRMKAIIIADLYLRALTRAFSFWRHEHIITTGTDIAWCFRVSEFQGTVLTDAYICIYVQTKPVFRPLSPVPSCFAQDTPYLGNDGVGWFIA